MGRFSSLTPREQVARLRLIRTDHVGPVTCRQLLARFGTAEAALAALPDLARRGGARSVRIPPVAVAEREMAAVEALGGGHLFLGAPPYPSWLGHIEDAPPVLTAIGHVTLLDRPAVALVGARNASAVGLRLARQLAHGLAEAGLVVVSGLARGIDGAAHQGALEGGTVAVIAGGLDVFYPPEHRSLQEEIARRGLVVAEQPPGTEPLARHFPRRNRIISGLSLGVVVVEAAPKSGSLITARLAGEQGREVMAVPGSPLDARAQGANGLIRDGATLVQSVDDILEVVAPLVRRGPAEPGRDFTPPPVAADASDGERAAIIGLLSPVPTPVDDLIRLSGLPPAIVLTVLLELELAGRLTRQAGHKVALSGELM